MKRTKKVGFAERNYNMKSKKPYEKPCAEQISFHIGEGLMTEVDIDGDLSFSTGGGGLPIPVEESQHPYQLD